MHQYKTRLGALVRDFSACFGYFTKWDRNYFEISWDHFEFQSCSYSRNKWRIFIRPCRDTKFLFECWKTFHGWALFRTVTYEMHDGKFEKRLVLLCSSCSPFTNHLPSFCQLPGQLHSWFQWYPTILTPSLWTGLWSSEELGRAGTFPFPSLAIFSQTGSLFTGYLTPCLFS